MTMRRFILIILSLGVFTSLITVILASRGRIEEGSIHAVDYAGVAADAKMMMARSAPSMTMGTLHQMAEPAVYGGSVAEAQPGRIPETFTSSDYGPDDGKSMGALVAEVMNSRIDDNNQTRSQTRFLIHEGSVELKVYLEDMESLADKIIAMARDKARGYVESKHLVQETRWEYSAATHSQGNQEYWFIHMELRIANNSFHEIINDITSLVKRHDGGIINMYTNSRDATDEYVDVSARADTLEKSRQALELLLTKANTVYDILQVQRELTSLTQQIESYRKRAIHIEKTSDMSRLSVHIREQKRPSLQDTDAVVWDPYNTITKAFHHMKFVSLCIGDALIYALIWAIPVSLLVAISAILSQTSGYNGIRRD
jgi:hypothetical protein